MPDTESLRLFDFHQGSGLIELIRDAKRRRNRPANRDAAPSIFTVGEAFVVNDLFVKEAE